MFNKKQTQFVLLLPLNSSKKLFGGNKNRGPISQKGTVFSGFKVSKHWKQAV
jgi:hypothetical protein